MFIFLVVCCALTFAIVSFALGAPGDSIDEGAGGFMLFIAAMSLICGFFFWEANDIENERDILLANKLKLKSVEFVENYHTEIKDGELHVFDRGDSTVAVIK